MKGKPPLKSVGLIIFAIVVGIFLATHFSTSILAKDRLKDQIPFEGDVSNPTSSDIVAAYQPPLNLSIDTNPNLDPSLAADFNSINLVEQLFINLVDYDDQSKGYHLELAQSLEFSPDRTIFTFTLRGDVYWTDGNPVTAQDVAYGILRTLDPSTNAPFVDPLFIIQNAGEFNNGTVTDPDLVGINVLSPTLISFSLTEPAIHFPYILSHWTTHPLPQWAIDTHGSAWTEPANIVTNGAYQLIEYISDDHLSLAASPTYYDADSVQIQAVNVMIQDSQSAWDLYLENTLDTVVVPDGEVVPVEVIPELHWQSAVSTYFLGFNDDLSPYDDPLVRKAFCSAIDRAGLKESVFGDSAREALTLTPPEVFGHVDGYDGGVGLPYNPTQAQQYLEDTGYPGGAGLPPITLWSNQGERNQAVIEFVQDSWYSTLNVSVTTATLPWSEYWEFINTGAAQVSRLGLRAEYLYADYFHDFVLENGGPFGFWSYPTYESLLSMAAQELDPAVRADLFRQAEGILVEDEAALCPLVYGGDIIATSPRLHRTYPPYQYDISEWEIDLEVFMPMMKAKRAYTPTRVTLSIPNNPNLDPSLADDWGSINTLEQLFVGLVDIDDQTLEIQPELADTWEMSPDGTVFTLTLRSDIYWSDGNPVTAGDIRYGILRTLDPGTSSPHASPLFKILNAQEYHDGSISNPNLVGVEPLSPTSIRFDLVEPAAYFPYILALWNTRPQPQWAIDAHGDEWTSLDHIVTNGPYRITHWIEDHYLTLWDNPTYYSGVPDIRQVSILIRDPETAWDLYLDDQIDTTLRPISVTVPPEIESELHWVSQPRTSYLGFYLSRDPVDDPLVRKALCAAIDRTGLVEKVMTDTYKSGLTFVSPGVFGHIDGYLEGVGLPYNPTQAQTWLSDAGYPGGTGLPPIDLVVLDSDQTVGEFLQAGWVNTLGITVYLDVRPYQDSYWSFIETELVDVWLYDFSPEYLHAHHYLKDAIENREPFDGWDPFGGWSNTNYQSYLEMASLTPDPAAQQTYYRQAEEILVETDIVLCPLYYTGDFIATQPYLMRTYPAFQYDLTEWYVVDP